VAPDPHLQSALQALEDNRPQEAAHRLREFLADEPAHAAAHAALGVALTQLGEGAEALAILEQAHYLQPGSPQILYNYGLALEAAGRVADARLRFEAALRLDPAYERAQRRLEALASPPPLEAAAKDPSVPMAPTLAADEKFTPDLSLAVVEPVAPPGLPVEVSPGPIPVPASEEAQPAPLEPEPPSRPPAPAPRIPRPAPPAYVPADFSPPPDAAEPLPSFSDLARSTLQLWGQQPLVWIGIMALVNGIAALVAALAPAGAWGEPWATGWPVAVWVVAFGIAAPPTLAAMCSQWLDGQPYLPWPELRERWARGAPLALGYALCVVGPIALALAAGVTAGGGAILLAALLLSLPFHVLLAPAFVLASSDGPGGMAAIRVALRLAGRRSWTHLGLMLLLGSAAAALLVLLGELIVRGERESGEVLTRVLYFLWLSLGESVWAALVAMCGLDALAGAPGATPSETPTPAAPSA
jgi:hypothetical protein